MLSSRIIQNIKSCTTAWCLQPSYHRWEFSSLFSLKGFNPKSFTSKATAPVFQTRHALSCPSHSLKSRVEIPSYLIQQKHCNQIVAVRASPKWSLNEESEKNNGIFSQSNEAKLVKTKRLHSVLCHTGRCHQAEVQNLNFLQSVLHRVEQ